MGYVTKQHITGHELSSDGVIDISYSALNASTEKVVIGVAYSIIDAATPNDGTISSLTWDQGGENESPSAISGCEAKLTFSGDRYMGSNIFYLDSPTATAGTLRITMAATSANLLQVYVSIYEWDDEADSGASGGTGTHTSNSVDPSISVSTRDSDSVVIIVGSHFSVSSNPFTPGTGTTEDLDADGSWDNSFFAGREDGTGSSVTIGYTQTTGSRNAASAYEVRNTVAGDLSVDKSDSISLSENIDAEVGTSEISPSDSTSLSENVDAELVSLIDVSDSIGIAESLDALITSEIDVNDSISLSENVELETGTLEIDVSDAISTDESTSASIVTAETLSIDVSDSISLAESLDLDFEHEISTSDSITLAENIDLEMSDLEIDVSDSISTAENVDISVLEAGVLSVSVSDEIAISENIENEIELDLNVSDSISTAENVELSIIAAGALSIGVSDAISLTESADLEIEITFSISDAISVSENVDISVVAAGTLTINVSDAIALSENIDAETDALEIEQSDSISLSENVDLSEPEAPALSIDVNESISLSESTGETVSTGEISVSETISISESISAALLITYSVSVSDSISTSESIGSRLVAGVGTVFVTLHDINLSVTLENAEFASLTLHDVELTPTLFEQASGDQVTWRDVLPPGGWSWQLPFTIQRNGRTFRPDPNFDLQTHANISVNTTYYVDKAATGANDGSSWEDAFTTLYSALSAADVDRIYIAKGYYYRNQSWQAYNPARSIEVIGDLNQGSGDGVYLTSDCHNNLGAWALDGNHYEATDGGRTVRHVWDKNNPDANGNAQPLTLRASEAEVDANANSWYQDATHVYVRLADGREPDSDVYFYESGTACRMARDNQTLYIENLNIQGGWYNTSIGNATSAGGAKFYAKNCLFKYGRRPGVGTYDLVRLLGLDESILWNCTVAVSEESDGIHYASQNGITPTAIEYDCTVYDMGDAGADQCSTSHNGCSIVRIMGEYYSSVGQCIADVDAPESWLLGVYCHDSESDDHFWVEDLGGRMWLDRCKCDSSGNYDITAGNGAIAYVREFQPTNYTSNGTVETY